MTLRTYSFSALTPAIGGPVASNWQSFKTGQLYTTERHCVARADILAFAEEFDPQPYHLDESAAQASIFGGLCASGWQICALTTRLLIARIKHEGIPAARWLKLSNLHWTQPVFVDDTVHLQFMIAPPADVSPPSLTAACDFTGYNQDGIKIMRGSGQLIIDTHASTDLGDADD